MSSKSLDLESVQHRATELVWAIKYLMYEVRLRKMKLISIMHQMRRGCIIGMYKLVVLMDKMHRDQTHFFNCYENAITRGHSSKPEMRYCSLQTCNKFSNRMAAMWIQLNSELTSVQTINSFKNCLD